MGKSDCDGAFCDQSCDIFQVARLGMPRAGELSAPDDCSRLGHQGSNGVARKSKGEAKLHVLSPVAIEHLGDRSRRGRKDLRLHILAMADRDRAQSTQVICVAFPGNPDGHRAFVYSKLHCK